MELEIWHLWIFFTIGFFILEIVFSNFTALCIGLGALGSGIVSYFGYSLSIQIFCFALFDICSLLVLKPLFNKNLVSKTALNILSGNNLIGKEGYVIEEIDPSKQTGRIIISGTGRKATTQFGEIIPEGSFVKILDVKNMMLIVQKVEILLET